MHIVIKALFNTVRSDYVKLEGVADLSMNPVSHRN